MSRESDEELRQTKTKESNDGSVNSIRRAIKAIEDEMDVEAPSPIWPDIGTKPWFIRYAQHIAEHAKNRMPDDKAETIHSSLRKFDPKFAELCKKAHDSAIEVVDYATSKVEKR